MNELEADLARLGLAGLARRNDLAGVFAVEVTGRELVDLAGLSSVEAIRPNGSVRQLHRN